MRTKPFYLFIARLYSKKNIGNKKKYNLLVFEKNITS